MSEMGWAKIAADGGMAVVMVLSLILFYRLADKYSALFLAAQDRQSNAMGEQAAAMASLAAAVREGQSEQREVLMAVRLLADRLDQQREYLVAIDTNCRTRRCA